MKRFDPLILELADEQVHGHPTQLGQRLAHRGQRRRTIEASNVAERGPSVCI